MAYQGSSEPYPLHRRSFNLKILKREDRSPKSAQNAVPTAVWSIVSVRTRRHTCGHVVNTRKESDTYGEPSDAHGAGTRGRPGTARRHLQMRRMGCSHIQRPD